MRTSLQKRDKVEKIPYVGVFTSCKIISVIIQPMTLHQFMTFRLFFYFSVSAGGEI